MPESVRRTKKSVPYFYMTRETVADRQNRPVNGLFCLYDLFFGEFLVFGQKICQIKILQYMLITLYSFLFCAVFSLSADNRCSGCQSTTDQQ